MNLKAGERVRIRRGVQGQGRIGRPFQTTTGSDFWWVEFPSGECSSYHYAQLEVKVGSRWKSTVEGEQ